MLAWASQPSSISQSLIQCAYDIPAPCGSYPRNCLYLCLKLKVVAKAQRECSEPESPCEGTQFVRMICVSPLLQLMRYQVIPNIVLTSAQLLDGISYSTALPNEYLTVSLKAQSLSLDCQQKRSQLKHSIAYCTVLVTFVFLKPYSCCRPICQTSHHALIPMYCSWTTQR